MRGAPRCDHRHGRAASLWSSGPTGPVTGRPLSAPRAGASRRPEGLLPGVGAGGPTGRPGAPPGRGGPAGWGVPVRAAARPATALPTQTALYVGDLTCGSWPAGNRVGLCAPTSPWGGAGAGARQPQLPPRCVLDVPAQSAVGSRPRGPSALPPHRGVSSSSCPAQPFAYLPLTSGLLPTVAPATLLPARGSREPGTARPRTGPSSWPCPLLRYPQASPLETFPADQQSLQSRPDAEGCF